MEQAVEQIDFGIITSITELHGFQIEPITPSTGSGGVQAGMSQLIGMLGGHSSMEGYKIETGKHAIYVLIDDQQSCCESWGYIHSEESDLSGFVGAHIIGVRLTDTALNTLITERGGEYGFDEGGIQFVDFITSRGKFQLAVYNAHNGYYGHGIVIAIDDRVVASDTL